MTSRPPMYFPSRYLLQNCSNVGVNWNCDIGKFGGNPFLIVGQRCFFRVNLLHLRMYNINITNLNLNCDFRDFFNFRNPRNKRISTGDFSGVALSRWQIASQFWDSSSFHNFLNEQLCFSYVIKS